MTLHTCVDGNPPSVCILCLVQKSNTHESAKSFWESMSGEAIINLVTAVPIVMCPWIDRDDRGSHSFSRFTDRRIILDGNSRYAFVQRNVCIPGWSWSLGYGEGNYKNSFNTAQEALVDVDREMKSRGWVLIGDTLKVPM